MISVLEVARRPELLIVDIRPSDERFSELGFVPGSISLPLFGSLEEQVSTLTPLTCGQGMVLCCTSGSRSNRAVLALQNQVLCPLYNLDGGLLAWGAAGLPLCRIVDDIEDPPVDPLDFRRRLMACFIAENTEIALDKNASQVNPYAMLQECFREASAAWDAPSVADLYRVLDRAAATTRRAGGNLRHIATNVTLMYSQLRSLEKTLL